MSPARARDPELGTEPDSEPFTAKGARTTGRAAGIRALPTGAGEALGEAVASFLAERDLAPSTHRVYALALASLVSHLGPDTALPAVTAGDLARFMDSTYAHLAPASWNRVVATLGSFFSYTTRQGWTPTSPAIGLERRRRTVDREAHARARAIPPDELLAFLGADHRLRDKTLWWMLYETAARAGEVLALDVGDLDLPLPREYA
ncbi:MAG: tyrosine-type recombinase/integrase [Acidimicrobiales bacterium]